MKYDTSLLIYFHSYVVLMREQMLGPRIMIILLHATLTNYFYGHNFTEKKQILGLKNEINEN